MWEQIHAGIPTLPPAREQLDRQLEAIYLCEQRHNERRKHAEVAPVALCTWMCEAEDEDQEDGRVDDD
ncbi:MAG TPA: hypothetical protein VE338_15105 [Ktedonobacterales bacterium]|jgi:hypothetical protein|nr:hypothetical protein [Ktedonobacterales bacterium]